MCNKPLFILALVALLSSGCGVAVWVLKKINGIKQPRLETPQTINAWLLKRNIQLSTLTLDSSALSPYQHKEEIIGKTLTPPVLPRLEVYDRQGNLMFINTHCTWVMFDSISKIRRMYAGNKHLYLSDTSKDLKRLIGTLNDVEGKPLKNQISLADDSDYTYILYWAIYMGKVSENDINYVKHYTDTVAHSKFVLVNSDFMERWSWLKNYAL